MGQSFFNNEQIRTSAVGSYCLLMVPSPKDSAIYSCFRSIARRWHGKVTKEHLLIEGDVPISSGLTLEAPPTTIGKLVEADADLIARIELEFGALSVRFERTGGHGPHLFRKSFFDQVSIELRGPSKFDQQEIRQMIKELDTCLKVGTAYVTEDLAPIRDELGPERISTQGKLAL